jgi:hypothetical protein
MVLELPGIYPSEVLCSLRRLRRTGQIPEFDVLAAELEAASKPFCQPQAVPPEKRMVEHPLDYEWRFTRQGVVRICDELRRARLRQNAEVLCLGCPSVFQFGGDSIKHVKFTLWDKNAPTRSRLKEATGIHLMDVIQADPPEHRADFVIIDPPWYHAHYCLFLWAGFHCLPVGGHILLSFPPEGTRPSVGEELSTLLKWCLDHGLTFEKREPRCLPYRSPLFEVNALKAQGVTNFPLDWRRGDLILLRKQSPASFPRPSHSFPSENWEEVQVQFSRVKVCRDKSTSDGLLGPVGPTEILPSVSSRYRWRKQANVVTSGNRFLRTSRPDELIACLSTIASPHSPKMADAFIGSRNTLLSRKAFDIISREAMEAAQYFRRIHEF